MEDRKEVATGAANAAEQTGRGQSPGRERTSVEEREECDGNKTAAQCQCLARNHQERYLFGTTALSGQQKQDVLASGTVNERQEAAELLHVLVSRPELASRPRDNIIFEGDMDLQTTFETSYEALAKMRLDQWRRYQQTLEQQQQQQLQPIQQPLQREDEQIKPLKGQQCSGCNATNAPMPSPDPRRSHKSKEATDSNAINRLTGEMHVCASSSSAAANKAAPTPPPTQRRASTCTAEQPTSGSTPVSLEQRTRGSGAPTAAVPVKVTDDELHASPPNKASHLPAASSGSPATWLAGDSSGSSSSSCSKPAVDRQTQCSSADIDQDLLSILVYDANMNRLEKMRIRKRSKYRPSTSLRSGAAGMFGDQQEESVVGVGGRRQRPQVQRATNQPLKPETVAKLEPSRSPTGANAHALCLQETRNLNQVNHNQQTVAANQLTFSEQNLPLSCKRKFKDNVNLRDHIREQNIMGDNGSSSCISYNGNANAPQGAAREVSPPTAEPLTIKNDYGVEKMDESLREELEDLRLAQQEEADAVNELQRLISTPFQQNITLPTTRSALANNHLSQTSIRQQQPCSSV